MKLVLGVTVENYLNGKKKKKKLFRGFPGDPVVKTVLPVQEAQVQSLAGKLGSHMLHVMAKNKTVIP